jgi:enoyl reductase-like protein
MGVDFSKGTAGMQTALKMLGYGADEASNRAMAAGRILKDVMAPIENAKKKREINEQLNAAGHQLFNYTGSSGDALTGFAEDFVQLTTEKLVQKYSDPKLGLSYDQMVQSVKNGYYDTLKKTAEGGATPEVLQAFSDQAGLALGVLTEGQTSLSGRMAYDPTPKPQNPIKMIIFKYVI